MAPLRCISPGFNQTVLAGDVHLLHSVALPELEGHCK